MEVKTRICDPKTGICEGMEDDLETTISTNQNKIELYYFTDPTCTDCWATEKVIQSFKHTYGDYLNFHHVMGGSLKDLHDLDPNTTNMIYDKWMKVKNEFNIPIDGSVWKTSPLKSSYPVSLVFLTINSFDPSKAEYFLRLARISLFVDNKNIAIKETLVELINKVGLDGVEIYNEAMSERIMKLLIDDFNLGKEFGIKELPSIVMINKQDEGIRVIGTKNTNNDLIRALFKVSGNCCLIPKLSVDLKALLGKLHIIFLYEIAAIFNIEEDDILNYIEDNLEKKDYKLNEKLGYKYIEQV